MWCLWTERNDRQFEDKERTIEELIFFFLHSLYSWTAAYLAPLEISYNDFLVLLLLLPNCLSCIPPVYLIALCVFLIKISTYLSKK